MLRRTLTAFLLGFLFLQNLFSQEMCRRLFNEGAKSHLETANSSRQVKSKFVENILRKAKSKLSKVQFLQFRDFYLSHFFYGRNQILMGSLKHPEEFTPQDFVKSGQDPFLGYMIARENVFGKELQDVLTIEGLSELQKDLVKEHDEESVFKEYGRKSMKPSERTAKADQGFIRGYSVINEIENRMRFGTVSRPDVADKSVGDRAIKVELDQFDKSIKDYAPDLSVKKDPNPEKLEHLVTGSYNSPHTYRELEIENSFIHKEFTYIEYVGIERWKKFRTSLSAELVAKLNQAEIEDLFSKNSHRLSKLRQQFLIELVEKEIQELFVGLNKYQGNQNAQVEVLAKFYWDMVSIHPFANGNGRTLRLMLERILHEINLPPPVWTYFEQDAFRSLAEFTQILKDSIYVSKWFHSDLMRLSDFDPNEVRNHMAIYLLPPPLLSKIFSQLAKDNRPELRRVQLTLEELQKFASLNYRSGVSEHILDPYMKWQFDLNRELQTQDSQLAFRLIPKNYVALFDHYSKSEAEYNRKKEFYTDEVIYRGTAEKGYLDLKTAVESFLHMTKLLQGNGFNFSRNSFENSYDLFNVRLLQKDKINDYARSQIGGNPDEANYWNSLMSSWSKNVSIAQKYADSKYLDAPEKGYTALIEAYKPKYGAFSVPEMNHLLGLKFKKTTEDDLIVVGSILPEMIQRMHFVQGSKKKGLFGKIFGADEETSSNIFTVERLTWNTLLVTELNAGLPFLNTKQYKVLIDRNGYKILE